LDRKSQSFSVPILYTYRQGGNLMKKTHTFEIFLTANHVTEESWLAFLSTIAKLNGYFHPFDVYAITQKNEVRFFLVTSSIIPPILNSLGDFLIQEIEVEDVQKPLILPALFPFYLITNKEKNLLDVFDKVESRNSKTLSMVQMHFFAFAKDHFLTRTYLYFQSGLKAPFRKKRAFLAIPHFFFSIDFSVYNRFFYRKNANEYLDIQKTLPVFQSSLDHALLRVNTFPYLPEEYYLSPYSYDARNHSIIIGSSGTGKSKFASAFIREIQQNHDPSVQTKVVVIDPHASLEQDIGGLENTCVLDFKDAQASANLFLQKSGQDLIASVELMLSLFQTLMQDQYNPKLERVLRHSIHLLETCQLLNFANLRKLLLDMDFRGRLLTQNQEQLPDSVIHFFATDFNELKSKSYTEAISPILAFLDEMELLPAFQENQELPQIQEKIQNHDLTIFSLDQASLGQKVTKTISGLVMQQIWELAKSHTYSEPIVLVVDEVSVIENPILARLLSEARKYNLSVVLIQQYFGQISEDLRKSIFANVSNYYVFRVSKSDALLLENNLQMEVAIHNSYKVRLKLLTELKNRECIVRICQNGVLLPAFKARTLDFVSVPRKNRLQILTSAPPPFQFVDTEVVEDTPFSIDASADTLRDIMQSQSSSRRQVMSHG